MRLVLSIPELTKGKGGAERVGSELAVEMASRGHDVAVLCDADLDAKPSYELASNVELIRQPFTKPNHPLIKNEILSRDPDAFFLFYYNFNLIKQYSFLHETNIPIGIQECTNPVRAIGNLRKHKQIGNIPAALRLRQSILLGAHGIRLTLPSYLESVPEIAKSRASAFPNAFKPARRQANAGKIEGIKTILNVSGLKAPNKNGLVLAKAFATIAGDFPDWKLRFVGRCSPKIEQEINELAGSLKNVELPGTSNDVYTEYENAHINVICSFEEGLPNVVCEAMLHGVPSIGFSDCKGTNEIIEHNVTGLLVDRSREVENLAASLAELMRAPDQRRKLGEQAFLKGQSLFDQKIIYNKWEALLYQIASYKKSPRRLLNEQTSRDGITSSRAKQVRTLLFSNQRAEKENTNSSLFRISKGVMAPKLSLVIPIYNKEDYLEETLVSVLDPTYPNKEIILVDDCSTDKSTELIKKFAATRKFIKTIRHKENKGLSGARNTGIAAATGEFVHFWDADDILSSNALSEIIRVMMEDDSDIGTGLAKRDGQILPFYKPAARLVRATNYLRSPIAFSTNSSCFKVYRKDFLDKWGIRFVEGLYIQDMEFNFRAFVRANRLSVTPVIIGEYRKVENSASGVVSVPRIESSFRINELTSQYVVENGLHLYEPLRQRHILRLVFLFFITKLLDQPASISQKEANTYLEKYRKIICSFREGIVELQATDPFWGLGMIAFACGNNKLTRSLIRRRLTPSISPDSLLPNPFNFSLSVIESYIRCIK